jgi:hypothetical protein
MASSFFVLRKGSSYVWGYMTRRDRRNSVSGYYEKR